MKLSIYDHLFRLNSGFQQVVDALTALRPYTVFHRRELDRFVAVAQEAQADTNSYLTGALATTETEAAGQYYRRRKRRQKREEHG